MKKTNSIRLFLVLATLGCCLAYGGGYYFSIRQSENRLEQELSSEQESTVGEKSETAESAVAVAPYEYVLCEMDGYVVVYYADRETVYSNTDIKLDSLPDQLREEVLAGKQIYSETELYNFLESYSS